MENSGGIQASLAGRYALALFELARDSKQLDSVGQSLATVKAALEQSKDFQALTTSPLVGRDAAAAAVKAVGESLKLDQLTRNFLGVLAENRRLAQIGNVIRAFTLLVSNHKGEITAEVTTAHPLDAAQVKALAAQLKSGVGRDVAIDLKVDSEILGGLKVKIGSQMIDSSIRTRLNTLAQAMKG
ncbi:MAG: F0F1 ATP synthase subunit delta [Alphaproteobacteria bacterium]|nr:F0F1 ATP synthase subunit delta [Alphaproteobacteria bacterium]